ncbi:MAG: peptidylprolyl isomerase [Lachnospiraceae bacterium]
MNKIIKKTIALATVAAMSMSSLAGCGFGKKSMVDSNGSEKLFQYDDTNVYLNEAYVYAYSQKMSYEQYYGTEIWSEQVDEKEQEDGTKVPVTLEEMVKEEVIEQIKMTKLMCNQAEEMGLALTEEEKDFGEDVDSMYEQMDQEEMKAMGATKDTIRQIFEENTLAQKVYDKVVAQEPIVLTYNLLFETFTEDTEGNREEYSDVQKRKQYAEAEEALSKLGKGDSIQSLATEYKADKSSYVAYSSVTKDNYAPAYIEAAEQLAEEGIAGSYSGIVETEFGYHIIAYIATDSDDYNSDEAQSAVTSEQQNIFSKQYESWSKDLEEEWDYEKNVDQEVWAKVVLANPAEETTEETSDEITDGTAADDNKTDDTTAGNTEAAKE